MSVARVTEVICSSDVSFDDAISTGIERANRTLENVRGAWVQDMKMDIEDGRIVRYRVGLKITFVLND